MSRFFEDLVESTQDYAEEFKRIINVRPDGSIARELAGDIVDNLVNLVISALDVLLIIVFLLAPPIPIAIGIIGRRISRKDEERRLRSYSSRGLDKKEDEG